MSPWLSVVHAFIHILYEIKITLRPNCRSVMPVELVPARQCGSLAGSIQPQITASDGQHAALINMTKSNSDQLQIEKIQQIIESCVNFCWHCQQLHTHNRVPSSINLVVSSSPYSLCYISIIVIIICGQDLGRYFGSVDLDRRSLMNTQSYNTVRSATFQ